MLTAASVLILAVSHLAVALFTWIASNRTRFTVLSTDVADIRRDLAEPLDAAKLMTHLATFAEHLETYLAERNRSQALASPAPFAEVREIDPRTLGGGSF